MMADTTPFSSLVARLAEGCADTGAHRVIDVLLQANKPLTASVVARRAGITPKAANRRLSQEAIRGNVSRDSNKDGPYAYFLSPDQRAIFAPSPPPPSGPMAVEFVSEIPAKIRFLVDIQSRPAFEGCAIVAQMLDDYRRTMRRQHELDADEGSP